MQEGANLAVSVWDNVFLLCCHHLTQFPSLQALLMLEENICSMSSFSAGCCLATGHWKMALCQHGVGEQEWSWGLMWALHRVLALWHGAGIVWSPAPGWESQPQFGAHAPLWGGGQQSGFVWGGGGNLGDE